MFGKKKTEADIQKEREIAQLQIMVNQLLEKMHGVSPDTAERMSEQLKTFVKADKVLPFDFKSKALVKARELECTANMKMADQLIRQAAALTSKTAMKDKGAKLAESRRFFSKACSLGGDPTWKRAYQRLTETVMLSGGVNLGPSKAKPISHAPLTPNRAKA